MGLVLLEKPTHELLREIITTRKKNRHANYTNDQIIKEGLLKIKSDVN